MLEPQQELHGFTVSSAEDMPEIDGRAFVMRHACGAQLLYLQNDDENKAFSITFRTPPADDTGVFHILEHSVLCGSDKFPVKEPFVNLLKSSMQTFLNAMTFSDKTMYPVASTNEQDLINLMDVYLDAVLNPVIYADRHIFEQEGHHLEVVREEGKDASLVYNGVVFNEMKGVLSDPESVLYHAVNRSLFEGTCYEFESGGHPRSIPQLTYEGFLDTHARHYRLDRAYIVLYGDMDIDRILGFLDESYLGAMKLRTDDEPNPLGTYAPRKAQDRVVTMNTAPENACVGMGYVIGSSRDFERVLASEILIDALMGGNESPLKRAILDAGLGGDCTAYVMDAQAHPSVLLMLKNAREGVADDFRALVQDESRKLVEQGIPRDMLEAALSQMSFSLRERDRGIADGVALAVSAMAGWLYSDDDATTYLHYEEPLAHMREGLEGSYFEDLLRELLLENDHCALVDLQPETPETDDEAEELAALARTLDEEGFARIEREVEDLRRRQEEPDKPEDLAKLPQLRVSDIGPMKPESQMAVMRDTPLPCLYHDLPTRHIDYVHAYFDLGCLTFDELPYAAVLSMLLGSLATGKRSAAELDSYTRSHLGDLQFSIESGSVADRRAGGDEDADAEALLGPWRPGSTYAQMVVFASALSEEVGSLVDLPREVWEETCLNDPSRIRDMLVQRRIALEESFVQSGHKHAALRAGSYVLPVFVLGEQIAGVDFYRFLVDLLEHFDERIDGLLETLESVRARVFTKDNCIVGFAGSPEDRDLFWRKAGTWGLPDAEGQGGSRLAIPEPRVLNEAFAIPSDVCYSVKAARMPDFNYADGTWEVLTRALSYDYLWNEVRVKGGAYGCGFKHTAQGYGRFHSYRDPQIDETLRRYDEAAGWVAAFDPDEAEMEGYVVSTVARYDAPVKPRQQARNKEKLFFRRDSVDTKAVLRSQSLACTVQDVRGLAPALEGMRDQQIVCTFGNRALIEQARAPFKSIEPLLG